jgi:membrane protease YdiL (CAAX protease family)
MALKALPAGITITLYFISPPFLDCRPVALQLWGKKIGWRGFLVLNCIKKWDTPQTSLITGIIWSLWHYPILLFADYNSGTPAWFGLSCFTIMVISISFIFTWFRIKSKSLWTGVLLHASHNLFIQSIFTPLTSDTGNTKYFIDEFGAVLPVVCLIVAIIFWTKRHQLLIDETGAGE